MRLTTDQKRAKALCDAFWNGTLGHSAWSAIIILEGLGEHSHGVSFLLSRGIVASPRPGLTSARACIRDVRAFAEWERWYLARYAPTEAA